MKFTYCDVYTLLDVGARADIKDNDGKTPLQAAMKGLSYESDRETKQHYKKVSEDTHTTLDFVKAC